MKKLLIAAAILTSLAGCATPTQKWETYAAANNCAYSGEQQMRRNEFINMSQHTSNGAITMMPAAGLEFRPVYKYNCKNGDVWTYSAPS